jgi:tetratricopeptide (TPR) repeat protein
MSNPNSAESAESYFQKGMLYFQSGDFSNALRCFRGAYQNKPNGVLLPKVKSYLGYTLVIVEGKQLRGIQLMREAITNRYRQADFFYNLCQVYLDHALDRRRAYFTLQKGIRFCPLDPRMQNLIRKMGIRKPPPLKILSRRHFLNRYLGKKMHP